MDIVIPRYLYAIVLTISILYMVLFIWEIRNNLLYFKNVNYEITQNYNKNMIEYINRSSSGHISVDYYN